MPKQTLSILVENSAGVLSKVSGLFSRRAFNIESLAVGITLDPNYSRITIVVDGDEATVVQMVKQLEKLVAVVKVINIPSDNAVCRELALLKVKATPTTRSEIIQIVDIFKAKIIDVSASTLSIEITGIQDKIEAFIGMLMEFGIEEIARTGAIALERGKNTIYS